MNTTRQVQITFDCQEPTTVAEFWKAALGYVDPPVPSGFDSWEAFNASLPEADQGSAWACQDLRVSGRGSSSIASPSPKP